MFTLHHYELVKIIAHFLAQTLVYQLFKSLNVSLPHSPHSDRFSLNKRKKTGKFNYALQIFMSNHGHLKRTSINKQKATEAQTESMKKSSRI